MFLFFFKQKTAYEMRISDWSSDVCSSDLLAQVLLVHMLRAHAGQTDWPCGWLGALNDDGIGAALRAVHADLAHSWSLKELAEISLMSRSAFAQAFKSHVGVPPLEYLKIGRAACRERGCQYV